MDDENKDILFGPEPEHNENQNNAPSDFSGYGYNPYNIYRSEENAYNNVNAVNNSAQTNEVSNQGQILSPLPRDIKEERRRKKKRKSAALIALAVVLIIAVPLGLGYGAGSLVKMINVDFSVNGKSISDGLSKSDKLDEKKEAEEIPEIPTENAQDLKTLSNNTVSVIKNVKPSVVCITSISESQDFFNFAYESEGSGSGIIFEITDSDIYILTNCHVVDGAKSVSISIEESDLIDARLIGKSENEDLAVIAVSLKDVKEKGIEKDDIICAKFGDSDALDVGTPVIAIGNALGGGNTATSGIISTPSKTLTINNTKLTVIQTDAAINPGNSGGALVNGAGEVIGINTAKLATTSVEGVGYSIPINSAKPIIESLLNKEDAPFLGVYVTTITEQLSQYYNLPQTGVIVTQIIEGASAENADIREGDIITSFNGQPIFTAEQLSEAVTKCKVGDTVSLNIIRSNSKITVSVKLKANPDTSF